MNPGWTDPPGPRRWDPWLRRLALLVLATLGAAVAVHFKFDLGPSSLDRLYELGTGHRSPARPR